MMENNKKNIVGILIISLCIVCVFTFGTYEEWELQNNGVFTVGKVTEISYSRRGKYHLHYEFFVKGKKYKEMTSTHYFDCIDDKKCIGNEYKVIYSYKNTNNSEMELGEYEKYKARIRFFKIDWKRNRN